MMIKSDYIDMACPKCHQVYDLLREGQVYCQDDGGKLILFNPVCICGRKITVSHSYQYDVWPSFPDIWRMKWHPRPYPTHCRNCGRDIRKIYKGFIKEWNKKAKS
jgi:hypothetical protein